jgi:hypothetical protein
MLSIGHKMPGKIVLTIPAYYGRLTFGTMNLGTIVRDAAVADDYCIGS